MRDHVSRLWLLAIWLAGSLATAAELPDDATLAAQGARVGDITIRSWPIFDASNPAENHALFRIANRLKIETRESAVRAQLLFASGDPYSRRLLEETERNLRALHYLHEPRVVPIAYHDGQVDIEVRFQNVWTLQFGPSFGRSGGVNHSSVQLEDHDLFGFGKKLKAGYASSVDRNSWYAEWVDPNVFGSRWKSSLHWEDTTDGHVYWAGVEHPFYALDVRRGYGAAWSDSALRVNRYSLGLLADQYRQDSRTVDLHLGFSPGLAAGAVQRLTVGWRLQRDLFQTVPPAGTTAPLPANRNYNFPYVRWSLTTDRFYTTRNLDLIDRTEDRQFGLNTSVMAGVARRDWNADRNALLLEGGLAYGWDVSPAVQVFAGADYAGRVERGRAVDTRVAAALAWYRRESARFVSHARLTLRAGSDLDLDHYQVLGGDTGLRGYPLRYQYGSGLALIKLEQRLYTSKSLLRLLDIGAAAFVDAGRTWGSNPHGTPQLGWLYDAGIGLRLGNRRSSLGSMIHVDLAAPLRRGPNVSGLQLIVATQETF